MIVAQPCSFDCACTPTGILCPLPLFDLVGPSCVFLCIPISAYWLYQSVQWILPRGKEKGSKKQKKIRTRRGKEQGTESKNRRMRKMRMQ